MKIPLQYSKAEIELFQILKKLGINFRTQEIIKVEDDYFSADFFIPYGNYPEMKKENGIVIEVQSKFHEKKGRMRKDEYKFETLGKNGYGAIEVWDYELKNKLELALKLLKSLEEFGIEIPLPYYFIVYLRWAKLT
jgi:G:T-mismatch repair DNA endonuclease (very short patch repair protein)